MVVVVVVGDSDRGRTGCGDGGTFDDRFDV